ncbi:MAG TPA: peptide-methionine (S)-S-oxide reductase MsrA [Flavobacteriaceae bacterium]|nr:peptide-methionine (S)-S-oxide reductase MsrA [Flavobacteriaceae bacterium]
MKIPFFISFIILASCGNGSQKNTIDKSALANVEPVQVQVQNELKKAYFASGCFWCSGVIYENVIGVKEVIYGYSGGHTENPTYQQVGTGRTGHSESVEVTYDPKEVSFKTLVDVYFGSQNVTQQNGQGPDRGSEYRSILFYQNETEKQIIEAKIAELDAQYREPIAAEVLPFQKFWRAEEYHQDYEKKNPNNPYIQNVSVPRLNKFKEKFPELLKENKE